MALAINFKKFYHEYTACEQCGKVYWEGSYHRAVKKTFAELIDKREIKKNYYGTPGWVLCWLCVNWRYAPCSPFIVSRSDNKECLLMICISIKPYLFTLVISVDLESILDANMITLSKAHTRLLCFYSCSIIRELRECVPFVVHDRVVVVWTSPTVDLAVAVLLKVKFAFCKTKSMSFWYMVLTKINGLSVF